MSQAMQQLYQQMILEHNRNPRNFKPVESPSHHAHGLNPLCGDDFQLTLKVGAGNVIESIGFQGQGCAISKSSASMMTQALKGKTIDEAIHIKDAFLKLLLDEPSAAERDRIGNLKVLEGVKTYPVRVKCATLIWRTLESALNSNVETISTE